MSTLAWQLTHSYGEIERQDPGHSSPEGLAELAKAQAQPARNDTDTTGTGACHEGRPHAQGGR
jgi:hypothetical protein